MDLGGVLGLKDIQTLTPVYSSDLCETVNSSEDFRRTACTSLLQHVVESWRRGGAEVEERKALSSFSFKGLKNLKQRCVGPEMIDTALQVCEEFLSILEHGDIDVTVETQPEEEEQRWSEFLQNYYLVVHEGAVIGGSGAFVQRCQTMLTRLQECCPQLDTDGLDNIWIIKPGAKSRGRGILCLNRLEDVLALVDLDRAINKESKWVVQKYLERPLLVHATKFDLRQWFLVTDWNPLTVWFYRECYLRFSTQPYSTKNLNSSVHLCNNSIQKHFQPSRDRHPGLPSDNMWSCSQFKAFLQQKGLGNTWEKVVVPGMQKAVVHALQTAQDLVEPRKASFELYGADFMLGPDLRPWLLEINASPTMACSTAVTARLCPAVQLDTLRVVLDWRADSAAYTGGFQLIYKQPAVEVPQYIGMNLLVEGAAVRRSKHLPQPCLSIQFPSDQTSSVQDDRTRQPPLQQLHRVTSCGLSCKENQTVGDKKTQTATTSTKKLHERRREIHNSQNPPRPRDSDQPRAAGTVTQRKKQRLRHSANRTSLVPRSLSFSLGSTQKPKPSQQLPTSHVTRFSLPQAVAESQHRTPPRACPSLQGPLPTLDVFSLKPNVVSGAAACLSLSSHRSFYRHHSFLCPRRQTMAKYKEDCSGKQ